GPPGRRRLGGARRHAEHEAEVVEREQPQAEDLLLRDEVADVSPREALARGTVAARLQRLGIAGEAGVAQVEPPLPRQRRARPAVARRKNAVEHVDPALDDVEDAERIADAHEVARSLGGQKRRGGSDGFQHGVAALPHAESTQRVAVEAELDDLFHRTAAEFGVDSALRDAEEELPRR